MKKLVLALCLVLTLSVAAYADTTVEVGITGQVKWDANVDPKDSGYGSQPVLKVTSKGTGWTASFDTFYNRFKLQGSEGPLSVAVWGGFGSTGLGVASYERVSPVVRPDSTFNWIQGAQDSNASNWRFRTVYNHSLAKLTLDYDNQSDQAILAAEKTISGFASGIGVQRSTNPTKDESVFAAWTSGKIAGATVVGVGAIQAVNGDTKDRTSVGVKATYTIQPINVTAMGYFMVRGKSFGNVTTGYIEGSKNIINNLGNLYGYFKYDKNATTDVVTTNIYGRLRLRGDTGSGYDWDLADGYTRDRDWLKVKTYSSQFYVQRTQAGDKVSLFRFYGLGVVKLDVAKGLWVRPEIYIEPIANANKDKRTLVNGNAYLQLTDRVFAEATGQYQNRSQDANPSNNFSVSIGFSADPVTVHLEPTKRVTLKVESSTSTAKVTTNSATLNYLLVF